MFKDCLLMNENVIPFIVILKQYNIILCTRVYDDFMNQNGCDCIGRYSAKINIDYLRTAYMYTYNMLLCFMVHGYILTVEV